MHTHYNLSVGLLLFAYAAGGGETAWGGPVPPPPVDSSITATETEMTQRWLVRLEAPTDCPAKAGWSERRLFTGASGELARYCLYDRTGSPNGPPFNSLPAGAAQSPDLGAVSPLTTLTEATSELYRDQFEHFTELQQDLAAPPSTRVRVAVLDTSPTTAASGSPEDVVGNSNHGWIVSNIIRNATCDADGDCPVDLTTRLGLAWDHDGSGLPVRDPIHGGSWGSVADLAEAVFDEQADFEASGNNHLVLNLSLGWLPLHGSAAGAPATWSVPVQALNDALTYAACQGTLIIASAGNDTSGPTDRTGALAPALWTSQPLTETRCEAVVPAPFLDFGDVVDTPLLHAVSAVSHTGTDLWVSRPAGQAALSAFGAQAVVSTSTGNSPARTGSSVSAAIASASAGLVWTVRPDLSAAEVVELVSAGGLAGPAISEQLCPGGTTMPCGATSIVDPCTALEEACSTGSCGGVVGSASCIRGAPPTLEMDSDDRAAFIASSTSVTWGRTS